MPLAKRHRVTLALHDEFWQKFRPILKKKWGGTFTSWIEWAMECYSRETCRGCPYEPYEDNEEKSPEGIGKVLDKGTKKLRKIEPGR